MNLIDKDALLAELDRQKIGYNVDGKHSVEYDITRKTIDIINTFEIKEVDLEKEINNQIRLLGGVHTMESGTNWYKGSYSELAFFAKYFFELGLKTQK